jgi:hypothetical protein
VNSIVAKPNSESPFSSLSIATIAIKQVGDGQEDVDALIPEQIMRIGDYVKTSQITFAEIREFKIANLKEANLHDSGAIYVEDNQILIADDYKSLEENAEVCASIKFKDTLNSKG